MKKIYIVIIVLVLVLIGVWLVLDNSTKVEAPTGDVFTVEEPVSVSNTMPEFGASPNVVEKVVVDEEKKFEVKEFTVSGQNFSFTPSSLTVKKGDKVRIIFKSTQGFHDFVIDEYGVATKQLKSPGEEVLEFIADKSGTFEYYCSVGEHRALGMVGKLVVN